MTGWNEVCPPNSQEIEIVLFGPSYGESMLVHVGYGEWIIIDSCVDDQGNPYALSYLEAINADLNAVSLIVTTHWHTDHVRGMIKQVKNCRNAKFCCALPLCKKEFLAKIGELNHNHFIKSGTGAEELYAVFSHLESQKDRIMYAMANKYIFKTKECEIYTLSPSDKTHQKFLQNIENEFLNIGEAKRRISPLSPNEVSVVLWIRIGNIKLLLGADLEEQGWKDILQNEIKPEGHASVFKVSHHGAESAHSSKVWEAMLDPNPIAVLTPWYLAGKILPTLQDVKRIQRCTSNAFITTFNPELKLRARNSDADRANKIMQKEGIKLRGVDNSFNAIRLRRSLDEITEDKTMEWQIKLFGLACHINKFRK